MTDRRTANARFYQLSDGRVQAEVFANPVHYRDAQGNYQAIDTRVGSVDRADFAAGNGRPRRAPIRVYLLRP